MKGQEIADDVALGAGVWIHYDLRGPEGAPLLVLLPPLGGSGDLFEPFRADLARDHRVLTCEPPGSGSASPPHGLPSTRALARDVVRLFEALGIERAHLFGISLGGMVAQWVAVEGRAHIDRLVLASTAARGLTPAESLTMETLALARCLVSAREPSVALVKQIVSDEVLATPEEGARVEEAARAHPHGRAELAWLAAAAALHDVRPELAALDIPTLVLTGTDDALILPALQQELASSIRGAEHRYVEGAAHDVTIDRPEATAALVRAFLAGREGGDADAHQSVSGSSSESPRRPPS